MDSTWLRAHYQQVLVLQVDDDASTYYRQHLPGARALSTYDDLHEPLQRAPVHRERFEQLMSRTGVRPEDHVVLCAAGDPEHGAYVFWLMRLHGHRRLSLLDGGLSAWITAGGAVELDPVLHPTSRYRSHDHDHDHRRSGSISIGRDEVLVRCVGTCAPTVLLDCRSPAEHAGSVRHPLDVPIERHRVPGRIPGSRNLPWHLLLEGRLLAPRARLERAFAERGVSQDSHVVVYCRTGERSALVWFALHEVLQHPRVRLYVGGWAEYGSLIDVPVERDCADQPRA
ncbi:sulfurtransferase [Kineococcus sp. SYSU DK005]|uniref:sulfurtransferase n=1 Tax=Kineococcus sp. SYSU DK005 TaxID=3383126 RepID=UPI003D7DE970